jgi:hypothetical protein
VPSDATNEATRRVWRELGFYYFRDDGAKEWHIVGYVSGLRKFARLVEAYASDLRSTRVSEHVHFGPYGYLDICTWHVPLISEHWIVGPLADLLRLSALANERIIAAKDGDIIRVREAYAATSPYELVLEVRDDSFDSARAATERW